jgi:hypothetical protein
VFEVVTDEKWWEVVRVKGCGERKDEQSRERTTHLKN